MSVFAFPTGAAPPPSYSATRRQPPPYKPTLAPNPAPLGSHPLTPPTSTISSSSSLTQPPPTYSPSRPRSEPHPHQNQDALPTRSNSQTLRTTLTKIPSPQPPLHPPPSYTPLAAPSTRSSKSMRLRELEDDSISYTEPSFHPRERDSSNWCCGCFWIGPSSDNMTSYAYYVF